MRPNAPIYIPSKGRWDSRLTSKALERMGVPYRIVVEPQEYDAYAAVIDPGKILVLDMAYKTAYDTCDTHGITRSTGSGPARNFIWDHAAGEGHPWHWIMDDNIRSFYRLNQNRKVQVWDGAYFRAMEDFTDRYTNVAMAGPQYQTFRPKLQKCPPFTLNSRIYSCNLIRTDAPFRWRGRYNEDTILSLDMMKAGWCLVLFNAFLQDKSPTQSLTGGNTDELYRDGTLEKSRMLVREHPDVARLVWKFNRWHHHVDYRRFKANRLIRKPDAVIPEGVNEYGMKLVKVAS